VELRRLAPDTGDLPSLRGLHHDGHRGRIGQLREHGHGRGPGVHEPRSLGDRRLGPGPPRRPEQQHERRDRRPVCQGSAHAPNVHHPMPPRRTRLERVHRRLDALLETHDREAHRAADPVSFVHRYEAPDDREVVGLVASALAFGNVTAVRRSVGRLLDRLGPSPASEVDRLPERDLRRRLDGFVHRVYRGPDLARLLAGAARVRADHGSIGAAVRREVWAAGDLREGLARVADGLRGPSPSRAMSHLVADPRAGSACKRLLLWSRWMARPADGVDLGVWDLPPSLLVIPVDTHVHRISRNLGLTRRRDPSWRTAEDITCTLRRFDPDDPVKYDFAICHLGVSRRCPSRRDPELCRDCVLRSACIRWARSREGRREAVL